MCLSNLTLCVIGDQQYSKLSQFSGLLLGLCMCMMPRTVLRQCVYVRFAHAGRPWSSRMTTVESNMKSQHNLYLICEDSPQRAFFFCTFPCFRLSLLASTVPWLLFLNAANHRLHSVLDSAKLVRCGGPTAFSYSSSIVKKRRSSLSSIASS